ncbi:hypothetical protein MHF_0705 [Mycoplasma haemofelis Ohio2]|uniref:Uncharacterized protein n=1 Tax=Mycoplasma haemofelis (strain Ohio2) TaxID=859194 RepID=F6FIC7_MYCHI|nr:hypothetical protein MHF_0705 [Mycoplasma haemofelis Ohio2]
MAFAPKFFIGGTAFAGLGVEALTSSKSSTSDLSTQSKSKSQEKSITVKKPCRLHKLIAISDGKFELTTKDALTKSGEKVDESLDDACLQNEGKDIFVSKGSNSKWGYYDSVQKDTQHQTKFKTYLDNLPSKGS